MTNHGRILSGLTIVFLAVFLVPAAHATNGYFAHGYGTTNKGMAGAGVALPQDALAAATNPAGMVWLGKRTYFGMALFNPNRSYTISGNPSGAMGTFGLTPGTVDSDSEYFFIPSVGFNWMLNDKSSYSLTIYGHGGMNTDWPTATFFGSSPTGVDLSQLIISNTYSRKLGERHSFGVSLLLAAQFFEAKGLQAFGFASSDPTALTNNGHDTSLGYGVKVGYTGRLSDRFSIGASYQSKLNMDEFDDYAGLFAEQGGFDIPATWTAGVAIGASDRVSILFDVQQTLYSDVPAIGNPFMPNFALAPLGSDAGAGFGWEDMTTYKLGVQIDRGNDWVWRFGYSHGDQPIPESEVLFNILAPGVMEDHITAGFSKRFSRGSALHLALMRAPSTSVTGPNPLEVPGQQTIKLEMDQWELDVSYSLHF